MLQSENTTHYHRAPRYPQILQSTTTQYYKVLQATTPVLLFPTKYDSSTTPVPVVPHKAVRKFQEEENYRRDWLL